MSVKVSIIIPCYNTAKFLPEALDSVLSQTITNWECIIYNDGSTDNTESIALSYVNKDNRFKYIKGKGNHGQSFSRNRAIEASCGTYILPLDSDDKIAPTFLQKAIPILKKNSYVKIVSCHSRYFGDRNEAIASRPFDLTSFLRRNAFHAASLFRRSDFDLAGGYEEALKFGEDWELWINLLSSGGTGYRLPDELFYYRFRKNSMSNSPESALNYSKTCLKLVQKYPHLYESVLGDIFRAGDYKFIYEKMLKSPRFIIGSIVLAPFNMILNFFHKQK